MERRLKVRFLTYLPFPSQGCMSSIENIRFMDSPLLHHWCLPQLLHRAGEEHHRALWILSPDLFLFKSYTICRASIGWQSLSPTFLWLLFHSKCVCNANKRGHISNLVQQYPSGAALAIQVLVFLSINITANKLYIANDELRSTKSLHSRTT